MDSIDYSVIIRTTGNAHEKYQKLLDSISQLDPQPREVLVVLPEGYAPPEERLGWETFLFCPKGMVRQRLTGINACHTEYALICDDDVSFPPDFVKKLHEPLAEGCGVFSAAPLYSFLPEGLEAVICIIMASAVPTVFHRRTRYVSVLKSTGYSYNRHLDRSSGRYYESQSVAWTCFYADIHAMRKLELEKESWLDSHGYSAMDDQTMFYKAWLMGMKTIVVADAEYEHLDGKTSTRNNKTSVLYSRSFNRLVFWHRFIYSRQKKVWGKISARLAFSYFIAMYFLWEHISVLRKRLSKADLESSKKGFADGKMYLKTKEYNSIQKNGM